MLHTPHRLDSLLNCFLFDLLASTIKKPCLRKGPHSYRFSFQDAQEFLRCLMDLLHEELKEPVTDSEDAQPIISEERMEEEKGQPDAEVLSCGNPDKVENEVWSKPVEEDHAEDAMLIQDNEKSWKDSQKEKSLGTKLNGTNSVEDLEKEISSFFETAECLNNKEMVKVQIHNRSSGEFMDAIWM